MKHYKNAHIDRHVINYDAIIDYLEGVDFESNSYLNVKSDLQYLECNRIVSPNFIPADDSPPMYSIEQ